MIQLEELKEAIREKTRTELLELAMELYNEAYLSELKALDFEKEALRNKTKIEYLEGLLTELENQAVVYVSKQEAKNETQRKALIVEFLKETSYDELVKEITNTKNELTSNNYLKKKYSNQSQLYDNWARLLEIHLTDEEYVA